jgi:hypothetical protein
VDPLDAKSCSAASMMRPRFFCADGPLHPEFGCPLIQAGAVGSAMERSTSDDVISPRDFLLSEYHSYVLDVKNFLSRPGSTQAPVT